MRAPASAHPQPHLLLPVCFFHGLGGLSVHVLMAARSFSCVYSLLLLCVWWSAFFRLLDFFLFVIKPMWGFILVFIMVLWGLMTAFATQMSENCKYQWFSKISKSMLGVWRGDDSTSEVRRLPAVVSSRAAGLSASVFPPPRPTSDPSWRGLSCFPWDVFVIQLSLISPPDQVTCKPGVTATAVRRPRALPLLLRGVP